MPRRLRLSRGQAIGVPLMLLVPALALARVFGDRVAAIQAAGGGITLQVEYPERVRYHEDADIKVAVHSTTNRPMSQLRLAFARSYIEGMGEARFSPQLTSIDDHAYLLTLPPLAPGHTHRVDVDLSADGYGRHRGNIQVVQSASTLVQAQVSTLVFP